MHHLVDVHQKVNGTALSAVNASQTILEALGQLVSRQIGRQFLFQQGLVLEGKVLGTGFQKEVKGVVDRHFNHQIDRDLEFARLLFKHQPALVVGKGVLLPVDVMINRVYLERIRNDFAAAVGRRPQANHLRTQVDHAVVFVVGNVTQCCVNRHDFFFGWARQNLTMAWMQAMLVPAGCAPGLTWIGSTCRGTRLAWRCGGWFCGNDHSWHPR